MDRSPVSRIGAISVPIGTREASPGLAFVLNNCGARALADYKVPDFVTFLAESLPRNPNGKLLKRALREMIKS